MSNTAGDEKAAQPAASSNTAPFPVLNGNKRPRLSSPAAHRVEATHIVRDTFFILGIVAVGAVVLLRVIGFMAFVFGIIGMIALIVLYWLMEACGYMFAATWGRQPNRIRTYRLLWDMIAVGVLLGGYMLRNDAMIAIILVIANLLASAVGLAISFKTAPSVPGEILTDNREDPNSHET